MKEDIKSKESIASGKERPDRLEALYPDCDAEAAEVRRMKEECDRMAHDMLEQIDALLMRIDSILSRDDELYRIAYARSLSAEDLDFLMHGNSKLEA